MSRRHTMLGSATACCLVAALVSPVAANATVAANAATPRSPQASVTRPSPGQATAIQKKLRLSLGRSFAGAWVSPTGTVTVATTDAASAATIRRSGAVPKQVARSEASLAATQAKLNHTKAATSVTSWFVDATTNKVVVQARSVAAARHFVKASGADASAVTIVRSTRRPRPLYDIVGGERYWTSQYGCSVAFSVTGGFVTAGHCGNTGEQTSGSNQVSQGTFGGSSFPTNDYAWVNTNSSWTPTPKVNKWNGTYETVHGATPAAVGARVCRSGSTTNSRLWCGTIQELNATVNYEEGAVYGLIRTNICADPGDSGGALITETGGQAQGITSGGSGSCNDGQGSGDETFFQPVTEVLQILSGQGRQLVTDDGGPGPGPGSCSDYQTKVTANITSGSNQYQPNGNYTTTVTGTHAACLDGPDGVDFDLYLQKRSSSGTWTTVATSNSPNPDESISYNGTAGTYRYRVHAYDGSGNYTLGFNKP
ncbi:S1 family peptidase [Actinomadura barringtoniae]|uniref:S1 family peptidase n=1 Tax=Actinomadura barringtoniae TaxID=1427535 RepID=A0A939T5B8_9ACTN|nr:S1 family peptidase [Actinomadura barringtoniae]MBO2450443.1 S1 family peptidase [Actinomadura barringtoniae]